MASSTDFDVELDIYGQQPLMRLYTQLSFCFPVSYPLDTIFISTLSQGLKRLTTAIPWLSGQVVSEARDQGETPVWKIKPLDKNPQLIVKNLGDNASAPTMKGLQDAGFPMSMLHEDMIAPRPTFIPPAESEPVLLLQLNLIRDGLILTVNGHHAAMDVVGQAEIIRLLSKSCRDEALTDDEIKAMNLSRRSMVPLLDKYEPGPEIDNMLIKPAASAEDAVPPAPVKASWACFSFSEKSLSELKSDASKTSSSPTGFISTDDALTALVWQSVTRVRLARCDCTTETNLSRAVDARPFVGAPKGYPGLLQTMTYHNSTMQQLVDSPLGIVASQLRSELIPEKLSWNTRASATYLDQQVDKSGFSVVAKIKPSTGLMFSSWAKVDCCSQDFGLGLGKPQAVRRPSFVPVECLMYLMPKALNGDIVAEFSLRDEDMERLKRDEEFMNYARYIG